MSFVNETEPEKLIMATAAKLEEMPEMAMPEWARFVKTGCSRERPPEQSNWWYIRGAAILRQVYLESNGVSRIRKIYSGRKNRGHKPEKSVDGSGKVIRVLLQQLGNKGLVKIKKGKGREIMPEGQRFLDNISKEVK